MKANTNANKFKLHWIHEAFLGVWKLKLMPNVAKKRAATEKQLNFQSEIFRD